MTSEPVWRRYIRFFGPSVVSDVDDEIEFHIEARAAEYVAQGVAPVEARARAVAEFGDMERAKQLCREIGERQYRRRRTAEYVGSIRHDLRYALRMLRRSPGFTMVVVLTLAVGIGASTAIYSVVDGVLLKPLPYRDADRVLAVWQYDRQTGERDPEVSPAAFLAVQARTRAFAVLAASEERSLDYVGADGRPEKFATWLVTERFFDVLNTPPRLGRVFGPDDYLNGRDRIVVLSDGLWRRRFGADPAIVGRVITLDSLPHTVVGVMPLQFRFPAGAELWAPRVIAPEDRTELGSTPFGVIGRLRPGAPQREAESELGAIAARLGVEHPRTNANVGLMVRPLPEVLLGEARPMLRILLAAAGLVLLIACANVAHLLLARVLSHEQEFAIRTALGAKRGRLIQQLGVESLLLALLGGLGGVVVAWWGAAAVRGISPTSLPRVDEIQVDARVLAFALLVSLAAAGLAALAPALHLTRTRVDLQARLKAGGQSSTAGLRRRNLRNGLIVGEVALTLVLLVGAGLLGRSVLALLRVERGFESTNVLAVTMFVWHYPAERRVQFVGEVIDLLEQLPGVRAAGVTSSLPLGEQIGRQEAPFSIEGQPARRPGEEPTAHLAVATSGYFKALRIPLRRGRTFTAADDARGVQVAMINETFARRYFPATDALGARMTVRFGRPVVPREIVGVVADVRQSSLAADPPPAIFLPHGQSPTGALTFVVHTTGDPLLMRDRVQAEIWSVSPSMAIHSATTLDALVADQVREHRFHLLLLGSFAATALVLVAVGVFGVLSHATSERRHEMGVRIALGAHGADIVGIVMRQGLLVAAVGAALGLFVSVALLTRFLRDSQLLKLLFGVQPLDPATLVGGTLLVLAVSALACYVPARRATRVDPVRALQEG
jgi:putative ABC transport system permease protein